MLCHFSGKPSTTRLSVAKYLSLRSYKILHIQLLATLIENLFLIFLLRYGQDDSFAKLIVFGSTAILLPFLFQIVIDNLLFNTLISKFAELWNHSRYTY